MREARARTADLKYDKLAIDGGKTVITSRKEDLVERLNSAKLAEMEAKEISVLPPSRRKAVTSRKKKVA
jgi:hypothetical protein